MNSKQISNSRYLKGTSIISALLILLFVSCRKDDEPVLEPPCNENCFMIEGLVTVGDSTETLNNYPIEVIWYKGGTYTDKTKLVTRTKTNRSGFYSMKIHLNQEELDTGTLHMKIKVDESIYSTCSDALDTTSDIGGTLNIPRNDSGNIADTTLIINYNIPYTGFLNISSKGTENMDVNDALWMKIYNPYCNSTLGGWNQDHPDYEYSFIFPAEYDIVLETFVRRNGIESSSIDTIVIDKWQTVNYKAEFK